MKRLFVLTGLIFFLAIRAAAQGSPHSVTIAFLPTPQTSTDIYRAPCPAVTGATQPNGSVLGTCAVPGAFALIDNAPPGIVSYTDPAVAGGASYAYQVTALCPAAGCSSTLTGESLPTPKPAIGVTIPGAAPPPPPTTVPFVLLANPISLTFSSVNGANPGGQTLGISDSTPCPPPAGVPVCHWPFVATNGQPWLKVTPPGGTTSASMQVTVNVTGLTAGTYTDVILLTVTPQSGLVLSNSPLSIPVKLTITTPLPPPSMSTTCAWLADGVTWDCKILTMNMPKGTTIKAVITAGSLTNTAVGSHP
jgi:hypothetical protein